MTPPKEESEEEIGWTKNERRVEHSQWRSPHHPGLCSTTQHQCHRKQLPRQLQPWTPKPAAANISRCVGGVLCVCVPIFSRVHTTSSDSRDPLVCGNCAQAGSDSPTGKRGPLTGVIWWYAQRIPARCRARTLCSHGAARPALLVPHARCVGEAALCDELITETNTRVCCNIHATACVRSITFVVMAIVFGASDYKALFLIIGYRSMIALAGYLIMQVGAQVIEPALRCFL